jgi:hypothetical protein
MLASLRKEAWVAFLNIIRSDCLAKAGYRFLDKTERSFQGALYSCLNGSFHTTDDTQASAERDSGSGRTDIVMEDQYDDQRTIYLFEKVDQPTSYTLEQIYSKDYSMPYGTCHKKVLIGLQGDSVKRNITAAAINAFHLLFSISARFCMRKLLEVAHKLVYHQRAFVSKSITT